MAERRMFAKKVINSDDFLDMPLSAQALYFHLSMHADDEGFVGNPKTIQRIVRASDDDCKMLVAKGFILLCDSGVIVIRHWNVNNQIQKDRFKATTYIHEKETLALVERVYTKRIQNGYDLDTQYRLDLVQSSVEQGSVDYEERKQESIQEYSTTTARACVDAGSLKNLSSHAAVMTELGVSPRLQSVFREFLRHCYINKHIISNDQLGNMIIRLDFAYGNDEQSKIDSLMRAISGGYYDVAEGRR